MGKLLAVAFRVAIGSLGRCTIALPGEKLSSLSFPVGTFAATIIGSLIIGFCWNYFDIPHISNQFLLFVFTGFLGGSTTFSTFAGETVQFIKADEFLNAVTYLFASNLVGIVAVIPGFSISHKILR